MSEHRAFPKPPKGYEAGEPHVTVEQSFYPKPPRAAPESRQKPFKPKPMDVRIVSMKGAIRRRLMKRSEK